MTCRGFVTVVSACLVLLTACSKNEDDGLDPIGGGDPIEIVVRLMEYDTIADDSVVFDISTMTTVTVDSVEVVPLSLLVTTDLIPMYDNGTPDNDSDDIDRRALYGYRIIGSDGFSAHVSRGEEDNRWEHMEMGGISLDEVKSVFDPSLGLPGRYGVSGVAAIEIYRMFDLVSDTDTTMIELAEQEDTTWNDTAAVALQTLVATLDSPESYAYTIAAIDDYTGISPIAYDTLTTGYWLLEEDRTQFEPDLGGRSRIRLVKMIEAAMP